MSRQRDDTNLIRRPSAKQRKEKRMHHSPSSSSLAPSRRGGGIGGGASRCPSRPSALRPLVISRLLLFLLRLPPALLLRLSRAAAFCACLAVAVGRPAAVADLRRRAPAVGALLTALRVWPPLYLLCSLFPPLLLKPTAFLASVHSLCRPFLSASPDLAPELAARWPAAGKTKTEEQAAPDGGNYESSFWVSCWRRLVFFASVTLCCT